MKTLLFGALLLLPACDSRKGEGGACQDNAGCQDGLVCQSSLCTDAVRAMKLRAKNLQRTAQQYMHDNNGNCPAITDLGDVTTHTDAWGNPFTIQCPSAHSAVDLVSSGPDGQPGSADDIPSWDG